MNMDLKNRIERTIIQSQQAYDLYKDGRMYYQAKRIYNINISMLTLLNEYKYICNIEHLPTIINYIFHIEDWKLQFEAEEQSLSALDQVFAFERFKNSIPFPKEIIEILK